MEQVSGIGDVSWEDRIGCMRQRVGNVRSCDDELDIRKMRRDFAQQKIRCLNVWRVPKIADEQNFNRPLYFFKRGSKIGWIYSDRNMSNFSPVSVGTEIIGIFLCHRHNPVKSVAERNFIIQHRHPSIEEPEPFDGLAGLLERLVGI